MASLSSGSSIYRTLRAQPNLSFGEWVQVFGDEKLTTALLDRLGHHAHVLTTRGGSYRTRKRTEKSEEEQLMDV